MGKGRAPCCDKSQVKRGPWSPAEDLRLITFIQKHGHDNWRALPKQAGLLRCGKSCRLRWINYLRPDVKRGNFTKEEEEAIIKLHETLGNKWSKIASHFPGRTDNEIKNIWNTHLKKKLPLKNCDSTSGDESKESSITSSSSSSFSSTPACGKRGSDQTELGHDHFDEESAPAAAKRPCNNNQLIIPSQDDDHEVAKDPKDQLVTSTSTSTTSPSSSNVSNVSNSKTQLDVSRDYPHQEEENYQMDNLLFDFEGPCDVISDILQEVNKPDSILDDHKSLDDHDQTWVPQLEGDYDFWNMFDSLSDAFLQQPNDQLVQAVLHNSEPCHNSINFGGEEYHNKSEIENRDWFRFLESELGLEGNDNQNQQAIFYQDHQSLAMEEKPEESDPFLASFSN
ncbi:hypothetical protein TIFTF001_025617 [Ficus carica]|uniref:MYB transcription factor n=1 Tax=Ficus carica TaxID=3494 RepID=A0AA88DKL2_FICCA|nr:hypothetical protein TIFTF001_025617 [Ficus carica]